jgi:uncharacterized protein YbaR (Trm112 family)/ubiquinone/menaquinone biosynthesis C-methylase UbiE
MKLRLLDLLACPCCNGKLTVVITEKKTTDFSDLLTEVKCKKTCAFKQCSLTDKTVNPSDCIECYRQEIVEGTITCECGQQWPIIGGIPRFLPNQLAPDIKKTQETFSSEWKMFRFGERNWGQDMSVRKNLFLKSMQTTAEEMRGKIIFDAGCGSGVLSIEMAKSFGMEVVALDLAFGIQQAYEHNSSPYVYFVQGSVLEPPLQNDVCDYLYCAGVLVACPDTKTGFKAIVKTLKRSGRCFIWVYHPITSTYHPHDRHKLLLYNWLRRKITSRLPIKVQYLLYLSLMPAFLAKQAILRVLGLKHNPVTWREKMQDLFDMFSPIYQHRHDPSEVQEWFSHEGFSNIQVSNTGPWGFGVKGDLHLTFAPSAHNRSSSSRNEAVEVSNGPARKGEVAEPYRPQRGASAQRPRVANAGTESP